MGLLLFLVVQAKNPLIQRLEAGLELCKSKGECLPLEVWVQAWE